MWFETAIARQAGRFLFLQVEVYIGVNAETKSSCNIKFDQNNGLNQAGYPKEAQTDHASPLAQAAVRF